jgi:hypothetical protein
VDLHDGLWVQSRKWSGWDEVSDHGVNSAMFTLVVGSRELLRSWLNLQVSCEDTTMGLKQK